MKWIIKQRNSGYLVKGSHSFLINNKHDAEKLCELLNEKENTETLKPRITQIEKELKEYKEAIQ